MIDFPEYDPRDEGRVAREDRIGGLIVLLGWVVIVGSLSWAVVVWWHGA